MKLRHRRRRFKTTGASQWCAARTVKVKMLVYGRRDRTEWRMVRVPGHVWCALQRWHLLAHVECCGSEDERESYACRCTCHKPR